jgi:hypothetical protein
MKKLIMAMAAIAALAVPAGASAAPVNPVNQVDENLRLEGQFVDVAANAVEGIEILPTAGAPVIFNAFGPVLDSDVRYREEGDPNAAEFDKQQLEWKAQDLRVADSDTTAIPAPDGTQLRTDVYQSTPVNLVLSGTPPTILLTTGMNALEFRGTVLDDQGNPILTETQDQEAELKAQFESGSDQNTDDIPDISEGECDAVVLVDDATGQASAASVLNDQTGANC